ncbi:FtsK/SpoIIIE domain-containing protein [Microbacterium sp. A8/3-1]|uniref:FtsK/SpoIIIE domain-containing protein n=1 Tax=Microbacterium sp. A8/3-1 TaxID=3160749 RepID=A0AAU7W1R3_9MICO
MARTTPSTTPPDNTDTASDVLTGLALAAWHVLRWSVIVTWWAVLFPMVTFPAVLTAWAWIAYGWQAGIAAALLSLAVLTTWRFTHPSSFRAAIPARIRARFRRYQHRRQWASVCALNGLAPVLDGVPIIPRLRKVRIHPDTDVLLVELVVGQTLTDWSRRCDALAHGWRVSAVTATSATPGQVTLTIRTRDRLATPIPLPTPKAGVDLDAVPIGRTDDGDTWRVRIAGRHLLVAGATGAGKGSVVWSILTGLAPAVQTGLVRLWVIDPKGGMEFGSATALFDRFVHTTGPDTVQLLRDAAELVRDRADRYRGHARAHTATTAEPQVVIVIDELASLTAYETDRKAATETTQLLSLVLSQGRAVGVSVIAAAQDPSKEVLSMRQLFPTRIGLRLTEATQVDMALGQGARAAGALCDQIPDALPGVGYQIEDGTAQPIRVRAFHVTDTDIDTVVAGYTIPGAARPQPDTDQPGTSASDAGDPSAYPTPGF